MQQWKSTFTLITCVNLKKNHFLDSTKGTGCRQPHPPLLPWNPHPRPHSECLEKAFNIKQIISILKERSHSLRCSRPMTFETKSSYCRVKVEFNAINWGRHGSSTTFETGLRQFHVMVVQRRQEKNVMDVQSHCFAKLSLLLFCWSCCCPYMYVWIHGHHTKNPEFEGDPALVTISLWKAQSTWLCNERVYAIIYSAVVLETAKTEHDGMPQVSHKCINRRAS